MSKTRPSDAYAELSAPPPSTCSKSTPQSPRSPYTYNSHASVQLCAYTDSTVHHRSSNASPTHGGRVPPRSPHHPDPTSRETTVSQDPPNSPPSPTSRPTTLNDSGPSSHHGRKALLTLPHASLPHPHQAGSRTRRPSPSHTH